MPAPRPTRLFHITAIANLPAIVHWVALHEGATDEAGALTAIGRWNERKRRLMQPAHVAAAWERLRETGWLS